MIQRTTIILTLIALSVLIHTIAYFVFKSYIYSFCAGFNTGLFTIFARHIYLEKKRKKRQKPVKSGWYEYLNN